MKPDEHSEPLFKELEILKLTDLITVYIQCTLSHYYYNLLVSSFEKIFQTVASIHSYNIPGLLPTQSITSTLSKQTMVNLIFALHLLKFGITLRKDQTPSP